MKQTNKTIIKNFHEACNQLAERVNEQLFNGSRNWYWVADDIGGTCDYEDTDFLNPEDMVRVLTHHVTLHQYNGWRDANINHADIGYINLKSWLKGARHDMLKPRVNPGEWVSTEVALPEFDEEVLVCSEDFPNDVYRCQRTDNKSVQRDNHQFQLLPGVPYITHWLRLPSLD